MRGRNIWVYRLVLIEFLVRGVFLLIENARLFAGGGYNGF